MNLKPILVPIDFSDITKKVVDAAVYLAAPFGSKIVLLHISEPEPEFVGFEPGPQSVRAGVAQDFRAEHQRLDEVKQAVAVAGMEALALHIQGPIVQKLLEEADEHKADMIVVGSHGHGAL